MRRRKWWSNKEREAGHEWVSEGLAADAGRRKGPVLVSISPTWLLLPPPPRRIRRLLQAKGKISADLSGLKSLALPWAGRHSGRVCVAALTQVWVPGWEAGEAGGMSDAPEPQHWVRTGIHCSAGCPGAMGLWRKSWRREGWICPWAQKHPGLRSGLG